jgi:nucleoside-diphosphate kinase
MMWHMTHEKMEQSVIIIKPDALQRSLVGEIITRFERKGLAIIGLKMMHLNEAILQDHYAHHKDQPYFARIQRFMMSAPVVVMAVQGIGAISAIRTIVGPTRSYEAAAGTIRGDFGLSMQSNIVHASDSFESAAAEITRFFKEGEILEYEKINTAFVHSDEMM